MNKILLGLSAIILAGCANTYATTGYSGTRKVPDSEFSPFISYNDPYIYPLTPTPSPTPSPTHKPPVKKRIAITGWIFDRNVSWYGPGFYGHRTACGYTYTKTILGVAHKTLPCGTKVAFKYNGISIIVPVIDRGPYVTGRQWDLSGALCTYLHHCFTGSLYYKILR